MARAAPGSLATLPPLSGQQEVAQLAVQHDASSPPCGRPSGAAGALLTDVDVAAGQQCDIATIRVNSPSESECFAGCPVESSGSRTPNSTVSPLDTTVRPRPLQRAEAAPHARTLARCNSTPTCRKANSCPSRCALPPLYPYRRLRTRIAPLPEASFARRDAQNIEDQLYNPCRCPPHKCYGTFFGPWKRK